MVYDKIKIRAVSQKGFWRCKVYHPPEEVTYPIDKFSAEQIEILQAEPELVVELVQSKAIKKAIADQQTGNQPDSKEGEQPDNAGQPPAESSDSAGQADQEDNDVPGTADKPVEYGSAVMPRIRAAVLAAAQENDGKKPTVEQVADHLGHRITAAARDEEWADIKAAKAEGITPKDEATE